MCFHSICQTTEGHRGEGLESPSLELTNPGGRNPLNPLLRYQVSLDHNSSPQYSPPVAERASSHVFQGRLTEYPAWREGYTDTVLQLDSAMERNRSGHTHVGCWLAMQEYQRPNRTLADGRCFNPYIPKCRFPRINSIVYAINSHHALAMKMM